MPNFSLYVLLLWAAAALVSATAVSSNFLIFDPPTITIENVFAYTNFKVKMASAPAGSATVNFQVDGLALSVCSLTFNSVDYGVFKQVQILPNPSLGGNGAAKSNTINIKASVCASGSVFDQATQVVVCSVKNQDDSQTCGAIGDPHFSPCQSDTFDFQGVGSYHLFKSDLLTAQSRQYKCAKKDDGTWVTCSNGLGLRYGTSGVIFSLASNDKDSIKWQSITPSLRDDEIRIAVVEQDKSFDLTFGDGSSLTINAYIWKGVYHMDYKWTIASKSHYGKMGGICNLNGHSAGYYHADGTFGTDSDAFGASWSVDHSEDMFQGNCVIPPTIKSPDSYLHQSICNTPVTCPTSTTTISSTTTTTSAILSSSTTETTSSVSSTSSSTSVSSTTSTSASTTSTISSASTSTTSSSSSTTTSTTSSTSTSTTSSSSSTTTTATTSTTSSIFTSTTSMTLSSSSSTTGITTTAATSVSSTTTTTSTTPTVCNMACVLSCNNNPGLCASGETCVKSNPLDMSCCPVYKCTPSSSTTSSTSTISSTTIYSSSTTTSSISSSSSTSTYSSSTSATSITTGTTTTTSTPSPSPYPCMNLTTIPAYVPSDSTAINASYPNPIQLNQSQIAYADAETHCRSVLTNACSDLIDIDYYVKGCAMDYAQSGSHVFIESSRQSYMSHCRHHTHWMSYSSDHDTRQTALSVRVSGGLGVENECPKSCSGAYGACTANGCRCIDGYSGHDCSIKLHGFAVASNIDLVSYSSSNGYSSARADKLTAQGEADASKAADGNPSSGAVKSSREYLRYATTFIFALMITIAI